MKWVLFLIGLFLVLYILYAVLDRGYTNEYQGVSDNDLKEFNRIRFFMEKVECPAVVDEVFIRLLKEKEPRFDFLEKQGGVIVNGHFFSCKGDKESTFKFVSPEEAP